MFSRTLRAAVPALLAATVFTPFASASALAQQVIVSNHGDAIKPAVVSRGEIRHRGHRRFYARHHGPFVYWVAYREADVASKKKRAAEPDPVLRPMARILSVSDEQRELGEERAARREALRRSESKDRIYGFYSEREAYDIRFPSVVYLDSR